MPSELPVSVTRTPSAPVIDLVDVRGPRFAAWVTTTVLVGVLVVSIFSIPVALVPTLGVVFVAFALFAALLNAAFGICLGCQIYPLVLRIRPGA